jgi:hypothetical protein
MGELPVDRLMFTDLIGGFIHFAAFYPLAELAWTRNKGKWEPALIVEAKAAGPKAPARNRQATEAEGLFNSPGHGPGYEQPYANIILERLRSLGYSVRAYGEAEMMVGMVEAIVGLLSERHTREILELWESRAPGSESEAMDLFAAMVVGIEEVEAYIQQYGFVSWAAKHAWGRQKDDDRILRAYREVFFDVALALRRRTATADTPSGEPGCSSGLWAECFPELRPWSAR